jgi:hypoxanthine phosphoribosyltransferase
VRFHFAKLSTYAGSIKSGGETHRAVHTHLFPEDMAGKDILIIEDIIDQGFTMHRLRQILLEEKKANSVRICALLVKRLDNPTEEVRRMREGLTVDFAGFSFPDVWIAGYGIDAAGEFRNFPHIITVNEALYR